MLKQKFISLLQKNLYDDTIEEILKVLEDENNKDIIKNFHKLKKFIDTSLDVYDFINNVVTAGFKINPDASLPLVDAKPLFPEKFLGEFEGVCNGIIHIYPNKIIYEIDNCDPYVTPDGYDDSFDYVNKQIEFENLFDIFPHTLTSQEEIIKNAIIQTLFYIIRYVDY